MERATKYLVHCLNSSPSKKTHAFSKADRFSPCKSYGYLIYNLDSSSIMLAKLIRELRLLLVMVRKTNTKKCLKITFHHRINISLSLNSTIKTKGTPLGKAHQKLEKEKIMRKSLIINQPIYGLKNLIKQNRTITPRQQSKNSNISLWIKRSKQILIKNLTFRKKV